MKYFKFEENQSYKYFNFLSLLYSTFLIFSVLIPRKIICVFGVNFPGGIFVFLFTYLLAGVIAEVYGRKNSVRLIAYSMINLFIFNLLIFITIRLPSPSSFTNQEEFMIVLGSSIQLFLGCFLGLLLSDLTNVYRLTRLKLFFHGKYFAQRLLWSTAISEAIFNVVTYQITYYGVLDEKEIWLLAWNSWVFKIIYSTIMLFPLLYLMKFLKRTEGIDVFDVTDDKKTPPEAAFLKFVRTLRKN